MLYLLTLSVKGARKVHSLHKNGADADAWRKCKEHDGEDTEIIIIGDEEIDAIVKASEQRKAK